MVTVDFAGGASTQLTVTVQLAALGEVLVPGHTQGTNAALDNLVSYLSG